MDARCRERIGLGTAEANQCEYCLSAHSAIGKMVGLSDTEILESARRTQEKLNRMRPFTFPAYSLRNAGL